MIEILSNGSKWFGELPDTIENLLDGLSKYPLDPVFEEYGNFVNHNPEWLNPEIAEKYKGCALIAGNFMEVSHVFRIVTDDSELINKLVEAINKNKETKEYQQFRRELIAREQKKAELRKLFDEGKITIKELYAY
jgi:hypothetical protein